jgi:formylglycine-generating enzyme required for sulfatase activity
MKKLVPIIFLAALALQSCGGGSAKPTPIPLPTAVPTAESNPTPKPVNKDFEAGEERAADLDGMPQVYVSAGTFRMGGVDTKAQPDEGPDHTVTVKAFWMDKVEVTIGMYKLCVNAGFSTAAHFPIFNTRRLLHQRGLQ